MLGRGRGRTSRLDLKNWPSLGEKLLVFRMSVEWIVRSKELLTHAGEGSRKDFEIGLEELAKPGGKTTSIQNECRVDSQK